MSGVLHGVLASLKAAAGAVTDTFFRYVSLLLNTSSTNGAQNNTFLDGSTNAFSITRNGNTTQGTFSPFSQTGWSNYFDGTGDYLTVSDNAAFTLGSGNFTVEAWIYNGTTGARKFICGQGDSGGFQSSISVAMEKSAANKLRGIVCSGPTEYAAVSTADLPLNQWVHVAFVRNGNTGTLYINGTADGTVNLTGITANDSTNLFAVGALGQLTSFTFEGYISNFRQVVGTAVYTANFTPPTSPLTAITNTSLLTCQSNRFIDNSSNAFAITRNGDVSVQAFSPFNPTAAWSASTNGGSGYFDGTGDYLNLGGQSAFAFGTNDFTVEMWIYPLATGAQALYGSTPATTDGAYLTFSLNASNNLTVYVSAATRITGSVVASVGQWTHVAVCRSGTSTKLFVNGTQDGVTWTDTTSYLNGANRPVIGTNSYTTTIQNFNGYISNARVVNGTAVYTANFTPPTAPLTAITNTSLLLNFTNAGIYDSASGNDLETVGNAQVSTTQAKWGTTSMAFDGTGDYLSAVNTPMLRFGTGDFTVEFWINTTDTDFNLCGLVTSSVGNWMVVVVASQLYWQTTYGVTNLFNVSAASILNGAWHHVALTRSGTSTRVFFDGVAQGASPYTDTTNYNGTGALRIGSGVNGDFNGYIDDLRITKGYARYTANFTPPTAAFPVQ